MYQSVDRLFIICKKTGIVIDPRIYELIGKMMPLDMIVGDEYIISIPVYLPYQEKVAFTKVFIINPMIENGKNIITHIDTEIGFSSKRYESSVGITKIVVSKENGVLWCDENEEYGYSLINPNFTSNSSSIDKDEINSFFNGEEYVKKGYFTSYEGYIHYLGNDMKVYKVTQNNKIYCYDAKSISSWMDGIRQ